MKLSIQSATTRGVVFALCGMAFLSIMDALAKWLVMNDIHTIEVLAIRGILIAVVLVLFYSLRGKGELLVPARPWAQLLRGTTGIIAPLTFFLAIKHLPLSSAVVVFFSSIFMTTMLSVLVLREKVGPHRWFAVIAGYIGVVIAMSPGFLQSQADNSNALTGYLLVLVSSLSYAILFISGKVLTRTDTVASLVLSYNICVGIIAMIALPWFWHPPTAFEWVLIISLAAVAVAGHFCVTYAFSQADASIIAPLEYTVVLWAVLFDVLIWKEIAGAPTWIGALIIIGSGLYLLHREHLRKQSADNSGQLVTSGPVSRIPTRK
ncbi:MAG: DMT family transporter [Gammaproteobacteria bacterium]|nr:DMT family transporter [Gammaproteobacteria bacterium]